MPEEPDLTPEVEELVRDMEERAARDTLHLLEVRERARQAKLKGLRHAAWQGFDEIAQGDGIVLKDKKTVDRFFKGIEAEVVAKAARNG